MKCTSCDSDVPDDAAVCPNCDAILDPELQPAPQADEDLPPRPATRRPMKSSSGRPAAGKPAAKPGTKPGVKKVVKRKVPAAAPQGRSASTAEDDAPAPAAKKPAANDWRAHVSEDDWKQGQPQRAADVAYTPSEQALKPLDAEDMLRDWKTFIFEMNAADKIAFFGMMAMILACVFPWKETALEGEVLGVMSNGIMVLMLDLIGVSAIVMRVRKTLEKTNPVLLWAAQLGAIGLSLMWCLVFVLSSWDSTLTHANIGNAMVMTSKPSFGVIFAFLSGSVAALGTVLGLKGLNR